VKKTLLAFKDELAQDTVIIDTCPLKRPVMEWAERILPEAVQFVGGHVVLSRRSLGVTEPSADLLEGAVFYLVAAKGTPSQALAMATNLAVAVGTQPHYIDAHEHDGLVAAACQLPLLVALATVNTVRESAGWPDRAGLLGEEMSAMASIMVNMPEASAQAALANADNLLHWLDAHQLELSRLRQLVSQRDQNGLDALLTEAREICEDWPPRKGAHLPKASEGAREGIWQDLFLGRWGRRR